MRVVTFVTFVTVTLAAAVTLAAGTLVSGSAYAAPKGPAPGRTHVVIVRPVDATGRAEPGWVVHRMRGVRADCDASAAPSAVDDQIFECFPSAAYLPACWPSRRHTVLCLRDALKEKLVRVRYHGPLGNVTAPVTPSPIDMVLGRQDCSLRVGGAWGTIPTHPRWVGFYSCTRGSVYGPPSGDGVDRAQQPWTVRLWKSGTKHTVVRRSVTIAYLVGTGS
jgi:hypothetical protein